MFPKCKKMFWYSDFGRKFSQNWNFPSQKVRATVVLIFGESPVPFSLYTAIDNNMLQVMVEDQVATFHLSEGSGPVYISGTHQTETSMIGEDDMDDLGDEEGEDEEDDEVIEDTPVSFWVILQLLTLHYCTAQTFIFKMCQC